MKRIIFICTIILGITFIVIQFFQPEKNNTAMTSDHLFNREEIPGDIQNILQVSCMDCHSDNTRYLWYHKIAPVSWLINKDITEGKKELNFSHWIALDTLDRISILDKISEEVKHRYMPLKAYVFMHRTAALSDEQIQQLTDWSDGLAEKLFNSMKQ